MTHLYTHNPQMSDSTLVSGDICTFKRKLCSLQTQDFANCIFKPETTLSVCHALPCRVLRDLNKTKDAIDHIDIEAWRKNNKKTLLAKNVIWFIQSEKRIEMPTKAFCKMYEILCQYEGALGLSVHGSSFKSVHLCEAPGTFVSATNHFLRSRYPAVRWDWVASTLADSEIGDDYSLLHYTAPHWNFGADGTGDIRSIENIQQLWSDCARRFGFYRGGADLVTANGSVDCSQKPKEQESTVAWLHMCEVVTAIGLLAHGGTFVLKMFTLFEESSVDILYLLGCFFTTVEVCKPITSSPGNGETYVVCTGFVGATDLQIQLLCTTIRTHVPVTAAVPVQFTSRVRQIAEYFAVQQMHSISRNLAIFHRCENLTRSERAGLYRMLENECVKTTKTWLWHFPITQIDTYDRLMPYSTLPPRGPRKGPNALAKYTGTRRQTRGNMKERTENALLNIPQPMEFAPHILQMMRPRSSAAVSLGPYSATPRPAPLTSFNSHGLGYGAANQFSSGPPVYNNQLVAHGLHGFVNEIHETYSNM